MSTHNDGGPAFPVPDTYHPNGQVQYGSCGMSLRDYFAGRAMQAELTGRSHPNSGGNPVDYAGPICERAYQLADAMLAARERKEAK
jgi:hypothetical protein